MSRNTLLRAIVSHAKNQSQKLSLVDRKYELTYEMLFRHILGVKDYLLAKGLCVGDCVVVENSQDVPYMVADFGIQLAGGIFVPLEKNVAKDRIDEIMEETQAPFFIGKKAKTQKGQYINIKELMSELYADELPTEDELDLPLTSQVCEILFSTGTTGKSKGMELTYGNNVALAENVIYGVDMPKDNVELIPNPLNHSNALRRLYANIWNGSTVCIIEGVVYVKYFYDMLDKYKVNAINLVPAFLSTLLELSEEKFSLYKEQIGYIQIGSAALRENDKVRLRNLMPNSRLYNFYGSTESGCTCIMNFSKYDKKSCIGRPTKNANFIFVDEKRKEIKATAGNPGFMACSGAMNMKGYYKDEKLTKETLIDGYIYSQDMGYFDEDGEIILIGRKGDVINVGGSKVSPDEVESVAKQYDFIADCACVPIEDRIAGQVPKLYVQLREGVELDTEDLVQFLRIKLEGYKIPKVVEQVDKIPRTFNGKILRRELK